MEPQKEQMYYLTLDSVLTVLELNNQTCQLLAEVPLKSLISSIERLNIKGKEQSACIEIPVHLGQAVSCTIYDARRVPLEVGPKALLISRKYSELSWRVQPLPQQSFLENSRSGRPDVSSPRWARRYLPEEVNKLPRKQRQVLLLINGQRGINELSMLLNCGPEQITTILAELTSNDFILW